MPRMRAWLPAFGMALAFSVNAQAQTKPSPEQARALETQITNWLKSAVGNAAKLPSRPVQLTQEGDHYLVRVPLGDIGAKVEPPDAAFTGKARQLDGTRWALDDQQFPPSLVIKSTETVPDPPDAKNPSPDGTHKEDVTYRIKLGQQDVHGVFDTAFATPTTSGGTIASMDIEKEGGAGASVSHTGLTTTQTSTQPVDPAHADLLTDATSADYSAKSELPDGTTFNIQAKRMHMVAALSAVAHDQLIPMIHLATDLLKMTKAAGGGDTNEPTQAEKAKMHTMLQQAHALLSGGKLDESVEDAKFDFMGTTGTMAKAELSFSGDAPADMLSASMSFTLDGLVVNDLPPAMAAYVPKHFSIHPTMSNLSVAALTKMGLDATAPTPAGQKPKVAKPDMASLFGKGGINFGFDSLAMDIAGTEIAGTGKFVSTSATSVTGQAELTARGLDALIAKAQSDPMLQQAVPVVIFLKGIARTTGDQAVWQITVNNTKVLVNGVDLSAMMGGMSK